MERVVARENRAAYREPLRVGEVTISLRPVSSGAMRRLEARWLKRDRVLLVNVSGEKPSG